MKILVIPSWYPPVGGSFFREHSEGIHQQGYDVDVLVCEVRSMKKLTLKDIISPAYRNRITESNENGLRVIREIYWKLPKNQILNAKRWTKNVCRLFDYYIKKYGKPDIIHVHCTLYAGYAASFIAQKYNIPYIVMENRGRFVHNNPHAADMLENFQLPMAQKALFYASHVVTVSDSIQPKFIEIEPSVKDKISSVPNPVDVEFFTLPDTPRTTEPFVFFTLGKLIPLKGIDVLLRAYAKAVPEFDNAVVLRIGGSGEEEKNLKQLTENLKLSGKVHFLGQLDRENVKKEMQNANTFVLSGRFEAFGCVYVEALATGLPVIATKSGGPQSIVTQQTGFIVDVENTEQLKNALLKMVKNYHSFDSTVIRNYAVDKFSKENVAKKNVELFRSVFNKMSE